MAEDVSTPPPDPSQQGARLLTPELRQIRHLEIKALGLLLVFIGLVFGSAAYLLYARGVFEPKQDLLLVTDDAEGVSIGMDVTFGGFPIGRVAKTELTDDGQVRIRVEVPVKDARWLRTSSIATLEKGLMGGAKFKIFSNDLSAPALPDGGQIPVLRGDITRELPEVLTRVSQVLDNVVQLTQDSGALSQTLVHAQTLTERMKGDQGLIGGLMGNEADARKLVQAVENANALLHRLNQISGKAEQQVFGKDGVMPGAQQTVREINAMLVQARESLKKVDQVLADATVISGNARDASGDLNGLRNEVEASLRKVDRLITDLNRRWPFAPSGQEVKLP